MELQSTHKKQVLLIDEQPVCHLGLGRLLRDSSDFTLSGCCASLDELERVDIVPDVIVIDILVDKSRGIGTLKDLKRRFSRSAILVATLHDETLFAERCLRAGAKGYYMKCDPISDLMTAIDLVSRGHLHLSNAMRAHVLNRIGGHEAESKHAQFERLSDRELLIVQHIGQSLDNKEIARQMNISIKTIESHRSRIKSKLKLSSPSELVRFAMRMQNP